MEKISFEFAGLTLLEPLSSLMNWVLSALCLYFFLKLSKERKAGYWRWFFLAYTFSFFFGGLSHLFFHYLDAYGKIPGWTFAILGVSGGEYAMISDITEPKERQTLQTVIRSKLFASLVLLIINFSFKTVMFHTAGLFLFVGIISYKRWRNGQYAYRYFLYGLMCLMLIAAAKIGKVDIHPAWFNRDDIAHVIMLGAYTLFFIAVKKVSPES